MSGLAAADGPPSPGHGRWYQDACGAAFALEMLGERWSLLIVREMMLGPRRFGELRAALPPLSAKVLAERLGTLEANGIVKRLHLPSSMMAQAYGLTEWGRATEPLLLELVRWGVRSPRHDPYLPFTPVALMLSFRALIDRRKAQGLDLLVAFEIGRHHFVACLQDGDLGIRPAYAGDAPSDLLFKASHAGDFLPVFYGKKSLEEAGGKLTISGDPRTAAQFLDLFMLPPKIVV